MAQPEFTPPSADFDSAMVIAHQLESACATDPRVAQIKPRALIRHVKGKRAIFHAGFEGHDAVVRLFLSPDDDTAAREWDEMQRLWPYMSEGTLRIARPLFACPAHGIVVTAAVPGTPLLEHLWTLDPADRSPYLPAAADWLHKSTAMSEGWRVASAKGWLRRARAASEQQPWAHLAELESGILTEMARLAGQIEKAQWRTAISHGDFHPNNLIAKENQLTGIDIGGSRRMPIYKDMARFLMHLGRRRVDMGSPLIYGVSRAGFEAFCAAFQLEPVERNTFLPFMLGFEALIRVETESLPASRIRRAEKTYGDLLADLRRNATPA
ncbi:phosphotransferase [Pseudohalocynthiibacter aestuariivivens]|nr:phosphotransferase [Pseudohalocynthiibacter aestuariivivens]QIE44516.1 phosphotransferase [Pseudohalocynthiibacter aestuariivivens]